MRETRQYAEGTELTQDYPFGFYVTGRALCTDGKVRRLTRIAETADTFFSVPASVKVSGKSVAGYITTEALSGLSFTSEGDPAVVRFVAYSSRVNGHLLPGIRTPQATS